MPRACRRAAPASPTPVLIAALMLFAVLPSPAHAGGRARGAGRGASRPPPDAFDDAFRKYSKRYFGPDYDWRDFKAQGLAESNLDTAARSHVGARGVMQLMPSTFHEVASKNPDIQRRIDDPEWNIAAGISYDRRLWRQWERDSVAAHRREFMFASYNAGRGTLLNAQDAARARQLDYRAWPSIEQVAPEIRRWRYRETLDYVRRIEGNLTRLDDRGRLVRDKPALAAVNRGGRVGPPLTPTNALASPPVARPGIGRPATSDGEAVPSSRKRLSGDSTVVGRGRVPGNDRRGAGRRH